jgi:hypothetical protein
MNDEIEVWSKELEVVKKVGCLRKKKLGRWVPYAANPLPRHRDVLCSGTQGQLQFTASTERGNNTTRSHRLGKNLMTKLNYTVIIT